jgi:hypothetical protein
MQNILVFKQSLPQSYAKSFLAINPKLLLNLMVIAAFYANVCGISNTTRFFE